MEATFYKGVDGLLSMRPPKFDNINDAATRKSEDLLKKQKEILRKAENSHRNSAKPNMAARSKIDTGRGAGGGGGKKKGGGGEFDSDLLAQAFQYADRALAMEALDNMNDSAVIRAVSAENEKSNSAGGLPAGNAMSIMRGMRGGNQGKATAATATATAMSRSKSAGSGLNQTKKKMSDAGAAYGNAIGGGGGPNSMNRKPRKQKMKTKKRGDEDTGAGVGGKKYDMEAALQNLMNGDNLNSLRAELEESQRAMQSSSNILRGAAGDFASGGLR